MALSGPTFSYGVWITEEGPNSARVTIDEKRFVQALTEALSICKGDAERAVSLIKAQVMAELRRVK